MLKKFLATVCFAFCLQSPALAWWDHGHMMVAAIAYDRLDPKVRQKVGELLKLNPDYEAWFAKSSQSLSVERKSQIAFMKAAVWPDDIKDDPRYLTDHGDLVNTNTYKIVPEQALRNDGYKLPWLKHAYWHYTDNGFSSDGSKLEDNPVPNVLTQIITFTRVLGSDAPDNIKSYDLSWIIHLVGDAHQPLHTVQRFSVVKKGKPDEKVEGDNGGNAQTVCDITLMQTCERNNEKDPNLHRPIYRKPFWDGLALHALWDALPGMEFGVDPTASGNYEKAIVSVCKFTDAEMMTPTLSDNPEVWISESMEIAKNTVYKAVGPMNDVPSKIGDAYLQEAREISRKRILLAGVRLASLLNTAFGGQMSAVPSRLGCSK